MIGQLLPGLFLSGAGMLGVLWVARQVLAVARKFVPWLWWIVLLCEIVMVPVTCVGLLVAVVGLTMGAPSGGFAPEHWGMVVLAHYLITRFWFLALAARWESVTGLFRLSGWPRSLHTRGPGHRAARRFREPSPWVRGPCTW